MQNAFRPYEILAFLTLCCYQSTWRSWKPLSKVRVVDLGFFCEVKCIEALKGSCKHNIYVFAVAVQGSGPSLA